MSEEKKTAEKEICEFEGYVRSVYSVFNSLRSGILTGLSSTEIIGLSTRNSK